MIAVVDYGVGNLFSLKSSLNFIGADVTVTSDERDLKKASHIILPGVGAFGDAVKKLKATGLHETVISEAKNGKPLLGICVGMQMLFEKDFEYGEHDGLGLLKGEVRAIREVIPAALKIPHIGWNSLDILKKESKLFSGVSQGEYVYFVHSYSAFCDDDIIGAKTDYGALLTAAVETGNIYGTQFHPEKSGDAGLNILKNFCNL